MKKSLTKPLSQREVDADQAAGESGFQKTSSEFLSFIIRRGVCRLADVLNSLYQSRCSRDSFLWEEAF